MQRMEQIDRVEQQVKARLTKEINHWDHRAQMLKDKERSGKQTRLPAQVAQERADKLADRLQIATGGAQKERQIMPGTPQVKGGALIIPGGLLEKIQGRAAVSPDDGVDAEARKRVEALAMEAVMEAERPWVASPWTCAPRRASATTSSLKTLRAGCVLLRSRDGPRVRIRLP